MKKLFLFCSLLFVSFCLHHHIANAEDLISYAKVSTETKAIGNNEFLLRFNFNIPDKHHVFTQHLNPSATGTATEIKFTKSNDYELIGDVKEIGKLLNEPDPVDEKIKLEYYKNSVVFEQKIKLKAKSSKIKCSTFYQICNESTCLPPKEKEYFFELKQDAQSTGSAVENNTNPIIDTVKTEVAATVTKEPTTTEISTAADETSVNTQDSIWAIFLKGLLGGLGALLMPCVYPMIPLTVSFFTKHSKTRAKGISNAMIYGLSMIAIFLSIGLLVSLLGNSSTPHQLATNPWLNGLFFLIFVAFALSFFGAFELTLPSSWVDKTDKASEKGGLIGIFFMAFTMVLVSFSCTAPIMGSLLTAMVSSSSKLGPIMGMFGFSLAFALPFTLFAIFPSWLNSLPKSGGWMNVFKVSVGFLELAMAMKFLSNIDLVFQWHIITREVFIASWVVIFGLMGVYLMGWIKFSHDSDMPYLSIGRLMFAILSFIFTVYLFPGLWGAPLEIISGFPPPEFYKEWKVQSPVNAATSINSNTSTHKEECPLNLNCYHDFESGMKVAKEKNKPLFVDFTGWNCANCRKMEQTVWNKPEIFKLLNEEFVVVSLYCDDRAKLPEVEQVASKISGEKITTVGEKWSDLQIDRYKRLGQPYYAILNAEGKDIAPSTGANFNADEYLKFLKTGIDNYKK
jgi:thiol:disulfide interchange protein